MKSIYLIRHGQTDLNKLRIPQGQEINSQLNDVGIEESVKTGQYLYNYRLQNEPFDCIMASPMLRAVETAVIIKDEIKFDKDILFRDDLKEKRNGKLAGLSKDDEEHIKITLYRESLKLKDPIENLINTDSNIKAMNDKFNVNYELSEDLMLRAKNIVNEIINNDCKKIIIVSHHVLLDSIIKNMFNISTAPHKYTESDNNCWISYIVFDGSFKMVSPPNNQHLFI